MNDLDKHVYVKSKSLLPSLPLSSSSSLLPLSSSLTSLLVPSKVRLIPLKRSNSIVKKNVEDLFKQTENNYQNILLSSTSLTTIKTTKSSSTTNNHYDFNDNRSKSSTAALMNSSLYISNNKLKQSYTNQISSNNKSNISNNNDNNINNNQHSSISNSKCSSSNNDNAMYDDNHHTTNQSRILTQRELLSQVTSRAWDNKEPLSCIPRLDELLPMHLSWNSKIPMNNEVSNCHHCLSNHTQTTTTKVPKNYNINTSTIINTIG